MNENNEMSESESILDASPFLKPSNEQNKKMLFTDTIDHVPSPPIFDFDGPENDNVNHNDNVNDNNNVEMKKNYVDDDDQSVMSAMTMGFGGRNPEDIMARIPFKNNNPFKNNIEEKTNKYYSNNDNDDDITMKNKNNDVIDDEE